MHPSLRIINGMVNSPCARHIAGMHIVGHCGGIPESPHWLVFDGLPEDGVLFCAGCGAGKQ